MLCFVFKLVSRLAFKYLVAMEKEQLSAMQWVQRAALLTAWCCAASSSCSVFPKEIRLLLVCCRLILSVLVIDFLPPLPVALYACCFTISDLTFISSAFFLSEDSLRFQMKSRLLAKSHFVSLLLSFLYLWSVRHTRFMGCTGKYFAANTSFSLSRLFF